MKFSIIMPVYNIQNYLKNSIESILNQIYTNFELILVDDGSTDNSLKICQKYQKMDNRINVVQKKNGGLSDARNYGLSVASGDYILFVDGDDFLKENTLQIIYDNVNKHKYDILIFKHYVYNNNVAEEYNIDESEWNISEEKKYVITLPSACFRAYKLSFLKQIGFEFIKGIFYEDLAIIPGLINYTSDIKFLDDFLYYYVTRNESIMHNKEFSLKKDDKFIALKKLEDVFKNNNNYIKYEIEVEYLYIKHLLMMYSIEILPFSRKIYKERLNKALNLMEDKFPNWFKNEYLKKKSILIKIYLFLLKNRLYGINKFLVNLRMKKE